jgi:hypothetical protein
MLRKLAKIDPIFKLFRLFSRFSSRGTHPNSFRTITLKEGEISKNSKNSIFGPFLPILATFY